MKILVINCGSSSLKYQLLDMDARSVIANGVIERIGEETGTVSQQNHPDEWPDRKNSEDVRVKDHEAAMRLMAGKLTDGQWGVLRSLSEIDALGHRVVQGGERFSKPELITPEVIESIRETIPLAPLHNPANLTGIEVAEELFPGTPGVAVFDTEFHQTIPQKAFMYPLPKAFYTENKIRKYGFHGTSHKYVTKAACDHLGKAVGETNLITVHLGNGCSMAAVEKGRCVDTTMGFTPLAGLMMGTRCGDIDPAIHAFVAKHRKLSLAEIDSVLNKESGLTGICGKNDFRDIHAAREKGDKDAQLAFEMFTYRVRKTIGAYMAVLKTVDAIAFTAGIGENDQFVRAAACEGLERLGVRLDSDENTTRRPGTRSIHARDSEVAVLIVPTDEELEIAQATRALVENKH
ncbi:acetate kinase [Salidesulfovibrio brasiliensis]|uniref:acetate kinase n=1 Tax=Salidesulfovibrio brasiliensis TaxID=221711 RepID=UPI0006CFE384|nr:acetate kinase [Salidesulfovibrio brasiliensis]